MRELNNWKKKKIDDLYSNTYLTHCFWLIMLDVVMMMLTIWVEYIHDENTMRRWVHDEWDEIRKYQTKIILILRQAHTMLFDKEIIHDEWINFWDVKNKRKINSNENETQHTFDQRRESWLIVRDLNDQLKDKTTKKQTKKIKTTFKKTKTIQSKNDTSTIFNSSFATVTCERNNVSSINNIQNVDTSSRTLIVTQQRSRTLIITQQIRQSLQILSSNIRTNSSRIISSFKGRGSSRLR